MVKRNDLNYTRLQDLSNKVRNKTATREERKEYMSILYKNGSITEKQYKDYIEGKNTEDILSAALGIGAVVLLGYLLTKLIDD